MLNNWHRYDQQADKLDYINFENMKNLYKGLSQLTQTERQFLANHYHHKTGKITDSKGSDLTGISLKDYRKQRRKIETKLNGYIKPEMDKLHAETGFVPFADTPKVSRDKGREDIITGLRYLPRE